VDFEQLDPMISAAERELEGAGVTERPEVVLADSKPEEAVPAIGTRTSRNLAKAAAHGSPSRLSPP
jgi:hypothetical protein